MAEPSLYSLEAIAARLRAEDAHREDPKDEHPRAAVAAILRSGENGEAEIFFIVRAQREGDPWSGHVAFPGGRAEATDTSFLATAIRETREEVSIDLSSAKLLARLPDVPAFQRSKKYGTLIVSAFVFALESHQEPVPNREVAHALWVPLAPLARGDFKEPFTWTHEQQTIELPSMRIGEGKHVLWGLTYRMLEMIFEALIQRL